VRVRVCACVCVCVLFWAFALFVLLCVSTDLDRYNKHVRIDIAHR
jgi:hypothetical protein